MRRRLFTLAAGASAVVFLATAVLWARTLRRSDSYEAERCGSRLRAADQRYVVWMHRLSVISTRGVLYVYRYAFDGDTDSARLASAARERGRDSYSGWATSAKDEGPTDLSPRDRPPERGHTQTRLGWKWMWFWRERYAMDSRDDRGRDWHAPPRVSDDRIRVVEWAAVIPWWVLSPPLALLPALWLRRRFIARRRRAKGLCLKCGFDLRATPVRCPECGAVSPVAPS
jgi:hypothetical protein